MMGRWRPEMGNFRWLSVGVPGQDDVAITLMAVPGPPAAAAASQLRGPRGGDAKMPRGDSEPTDARPEGMLLRPELVVLLILAGAAIAAAVILPFAHSTQRSQKFVESPEFIVWFVLIAAQTALWAVSCAVFLGVNRSLSRMREAVAAYFADAVRRCRIVPVFEARRLEVEVDAPSVPSAKPQARAAYAGLRSIGCPAGV